MTLLFERVSFNYFETIRSQMLKSAFEILSKSKLGLIQILIASIYQKSRLSLDVWSIWVPVHAFCKIAINFCWFQRANHNWVLRVKRFRDKIFLINRSIYFHSKLQNSFRFSILQRQRHVDTLKERFTIKSEIIYFIKAHQLIVKRSCT